MIQVDVGLSLLPTFHACHSVHVGEPHHDRQTWEDENEGLGVPLQAGQDMVWRRTDREDRGVEDICL